MRDQIGFFRLMGGIFAGIGAVLSVMLWVPSLFAIVMARRVIGGDAFAKGLGG